MTEKLAFRIGDLVKLQKDGVIVADGFIILVTNQQRLDTAFLATGILKITDIERIVEKEIVVQYPFDYVIAKIKSFSDDYVSLDNNLHFLQVHEDELTR